MSDQNRRAYDDIAEEYHAKRRDPSRNAWNEYLEVPAATRLLEHRVRKKRVLDVGCGTGILSAKIKRWGAADVFGVDPSSKMIEIAEQENPGLYFQVGSAEKLPYADAMFDVVASSLVLHYLKDLNPPLQEISRVLKPGGDLIFTMHHPLQESMDYPSIHDERPPIAKPYFNNDRYTWNLCGVELENYHHTFEDIFKALQSAQMVWQDLIECRPDPRSKDHFPGFAFTSQYPTFIAIHAQKKTI
jgi:ubiquinone/menaquinone biosynthesis C-methylase UbiE